MDMTKFLSQAAL